MEPVRTLDNYVPEDNRTLGVWAYLWCSKYLLQPDGPDAGSPWRFTPEQIRIIKRWYEIDENGRFVYRQGTIRRLKGWGKDPFTAALCAFEFVGPCRFSHWDADGMPVPKAQNSAWVQIAATSKDQTRNTMTVFPGLFSEECIEKYGIDLGKEIIYSAVGNRIEAVTSSARALEGGRASFNLLNETQHWVEANGGHSMAMTIAGNLAKSRGGGARSMEITNAPLPGEDSVAERTYHAWSKLRDKDPETPRRAGVYYDSVEAPASVVLGDRESLEAGIRAARGDATWLDIDWIISTIYAGTYPAYQSRRMFLNQLVTDEDSLISPVAWDACQTDESLKRNDRITLGFDGGSTDDATALIAMRMSDRLVQPIGIWEQPDGPAGEGWEVPRDQVVDAVHNTFANYDVVGFFADVALWESEVESWSEEYRTRLHVKASGKSTVGRDMRGGLPELTQANERLVAAVEAGAIRHTGHHTLKRHVMNAKRKINRFGVSFTKEHRESKRKVDGYAAMLLADLARHNLVESGKLKRPRSGRVWGFGA
ncbi:terminase [Streptomyces sp. MJM1172]|uniref:terminase n=1 Tax=Streptomyces sp. MJM1172 TaxID=1703926 RepID=UPI00093AC99E|nr:terminase [Streptomyces sp. MJM1172]OKI71421.1 terminase [Streptomyces sp. MJM1172]